MTFTTELKELVLRALNQFHVIENRVQRVDIHWTETHRQVLHVALQSGALPGHEFIQAVEARLIDIGLQMAKQATSHPADHVDSSQALAFVLKFHRHRIPVKTLRNIRFDHGDTADTFMLDEADRLLEKISKELRTEPQRNRWPESADLIAAGGD